MFWLNDEYYTYAVAMFAIATLSVLISLFQTRRYMKQLRDMAATRTTVSVLRDGKGENKTRYLLCDLLTSPADFYDLYTLLCSV